MVPPKDVRVLLSGICEYIIVGQRREGFTGRDKVANQLTELGGLSWMILVYQCNFKSHEKWKRKAEEECESQ